MQGRKKKFLLLGGSVLLLIVLGFVIFYVFHKQPAKKKAAVKAPTQTVEEAKKAHTAYADLNTIVQKYNNKEYAAVISLTRQFDTSASAPSYEKLQAYTLCLDSAVQTKDNDGKEFCYVKAKALAQASPDEQTRIQLTKQLDSTYNGVPYTEGSINDGQSQ